MTSAFPCNRCGACCRHVDIAEETRFLDRGDGVCSNFDVTNSICSIYSTRPAVCRVDDQFRVNYHHQYTWDNFVELNLIACEQIRKFDVARQPTSVKST
jgi:Fe-S-cluster containining protein